MKAADLTPFPNIEGVFKSKSPQPSLRGTVIEGLHGAYSNQISDVEKCLNVFKSSSIFQVPQLKEQTDKLFSSNPDDWNCARQELLALSTVETDGSLASLGWPSGYGGNAPFDGVLKDTAANNQLIAFDVKSAQGDGLSLLVEHLTPIAQNWATQQQLGNIQLDIVHEGLLMQRFVRQDLNGFQTNFQNSLPQPGSLPHKIQLVSNKTTITVTVERYSPIIVHSGIGGVDTRVEAIYIVMDDHVRKKAKIAAAKTRPFVLVYVRPFGAGASDVQPEPARKAACVLDALGGSPWWLGTLLLDWTTGTLQRTGFLRAHANYPNGSNAQSLQSTLKY